MIFKKLCTLLSVLPVLLFTSVQGVLALEIEISGNSGESNQVSVTSQTTTEVSQTNTATVNNDVTVNANTGDNTANNNGGDTSITTGNVETNVVINNSLNTSTAQAGCCTSDTNSVTISGNSSGSNTVSVDSSSTTSLIINQVASIHNNIQGSANTGKNNAFGNSGKVDITTGLIKHNDTIINHAVNQTNTKLSVNDPEWNVKIKNNSGNSVVLLTLTNDAITNIYNNADIHNISLWNLTTGENNAYKNEGPVTITTGSIYASTAIKNEGINVNSATVDCCDEKVDPPPPPPPPPPPDNNGGNGGPGDKVGNGGGNGGGGVGGSGSSTGSVLGAAILPATGASFWLFATIANILMFLLGLYLRMKAGRSPTKAYAIR